jgi:hypothetical protein
MKPEIFLGVFFFGLFLFQLGGVIVIAIQKTMTVGFLLSAIVACIAFLIVNSYSLTKGFEEKL